MAAEQQAQAQTWRPNPGPQERFLASTAYEVLYGGAAGGGKSESLLVAPLRWVGHPGFRARLLRRTIPELEDARGLVERANEMYPSLGAWYHETKRVWSFPSGAKIRFGACEHEKDVQKFRGEYQYVGFDELTTFSERIYTYLLSRMRTPHGLPLRLRSASNPGGIGHDWVLKRWAPWLYPPGHDGYDGPYAKPGEVLWFVRDLNGVERIVPSGTPDAISRSFIPARTSDTPQLDEQYRAKLRALDPVTRAQLEHGNWMARPASGAYFKRAWFQMINRDEIPSDVVTRVRYWDRASSTDPRADFTAGVRMSRTAKGMYIVEDVVRGQWGPGDVEKTIGSTSGLDPKDTALWLEQDPGQAGVAQKHHDGTTYDGANVHFVRPTGDKLTRAKPFSAQAEAGNVKIVRGRWNDAYIAELEACPEGLWDQIDASSGAYSQCRYYTGTKTKTGGKREMRPDAMGGW